MRIMKQSTERAIQKSTKQGDFEFIHLSLGSVEVIKEALERFAADSFRASYVLDLMNSSSGILFVTEHN
jgi:hypothetical protein